MSEATTGAEVIPEFTIGDRLRKARELTGLDQTEFADEIGVSRQSVSNYELGNTKPRKIVLMAWQLRTGVPVKWLEHGTMAGGYQDLGDYGPPTDALNPDIPSGMSVDHSPSRAEILAHRKTFRLKYATDADQAVAS